MTYQVTVVGQEQISGAAGPVAAVRVDYEGPSGRLASVWVDTDAHHAVREGMSPAPGMEIFIIPTRAHDSGRAPF